MQMIDISIITPCTSHHNLARFLHQLSEQSNDGITYELILILEAQDHSKFANIYNPLLNRAKIFRSKPHYDYGASAKDTGLLHALGEYVLFWDDDNLYYKHAITAQYANAVGCDLGISKAYHLNYLIPNGNKISPGDIDTINICVKRELAKKCKWSHNSTKYSDYIYITKLLEYNPIVRYSNIIIGHHL